MLQANPSHLSQRQSKTTAMKRLAQVLLLMMITLGLDGQGLAVSNQAAAAGAPGEAVRVRSVYGYTAEHQTKALGAKNDNNEKNLRFAGATNEVAAKRLKLILLLMMSQGQSRTPGY